jgi:signal transduction histidine kinase
MGRHPHSEGSERTTSPPPLAQELLVYAALEDTAAAVEAERRRLAGLLQTNVIESLNLLLAQANAYEQTLSANPTARMAVSVLASLARQIVQEVRDLEANLHPTILEALGLEPALDALTSQVTRAHGLQITLALERLRERLPHRVELALFRAAQDALDRTVRHAHASQATIRLERREDRLLFSLSDNGVSASGSEALSAACQRIEQLGGTVETGCGPHGGFELRISLALKPPVQLTPREMDVIRLLAEGLSNKEIARLLSISPRTVNFHLDNIYSKLGVSSRTEAAIYALRHGWTRQSPTK